MTTAEKLRKAEKRVEKAQSALDKTHSGLHAAESVASTTEKAARHPVLIAVAVLAVVGLIWWLIQAGGEES